MDVFEAIYGRRSIRQFKSRPVPDKIIKKILDAARWAPSACNRQLWEFVIVRDMTIKNRIADEVCYKQSFIKNAPVLIAVFYDDTKERKNEIGPRKHDSIQSAAAAIQNIHLASYALGLGSLWICAIKYMLKLNEILLVPQHIRPIALITLGYPAEQVKPPARRSFEEMVHFEKYQSDSRTFPNSFDPWVWTIKELADFRSRICWYGGTLTEDRTLEKFSMKDKGYQRILEVIGDNLPKNREKGLDIFSFGGGYLIGLMKKLYGINQWHVIELHDGNIHFIKQNLEAFHLPEPDFLLVPADTLAFPRKKFDLITCFNRLEQFADPLVLLTQIYTVLNKNGRCFLVVEVDSILIALWRTVLRLRKQNIHNSPLWERGPYRRFSRKKILNLIGSTEFRIVHQVKIPEGGWLKSTLKKGLRGSGTTLLLVLEK